MLFFATSSFVLWYCSQFRRPQYCCSCCRCCFCHLPTLFWTLSATVLSFLVGVSGTVLVVHDDTVFCCQTRIKWVRNSPTNIHLCSCLCVRWTNWKETTRTIFLCTSIILPNCWQRYLECFLLFSSFHISILRNSIEILACQE